MDAQRRDWRPRRAVRHRGRGGPLRGLTASGAVAMRLFLDQGFEQTTIDQIAATAGI
ncbi:MAG: TetR family transcriptional regulator, partial [Micrococcales bacterium]|nr:TetR family transcriptional regulator [Micrococcales bacterium]